MMSPNSIRHYVEEIEFLRKEKEEWEERYNKAAATLFEERFMRSSSIRDLLDQIRKMYGEHFHVNEGKEFEDISKLLGNQIKIKEDLQSQLNRLKEINEKVENENQRLNLEKIKAEKKYNSSKERLESLHQLQQNLTDEIKIKEDFQLQLNRLNEINEKVENENQRLKLENIKVEKEYNSLKERLESLNQLQQKLTDEMKQLENMKEGFNIRKVCQASKPDIKNMENKIEAETRAITKTALLPEVEKTSVLDKDTNCSRPKQECNPVKEKSDLLGNFYLCEVHLPMLQKCQDRKMVKPTNPLGVKKDKTPMYLKRLQQPAHLDVYWKPIHSSRRQIAKRDDIKSNN